MASRIPGPISHIYFSQRTRLHYVDWGNEDAPPLLLVHGGRDHCRNWDWVAEALRDEYHIIAPDLLGHGDSEWCSTGNYVMTDYVYDIAQLIHQKQMAPLTIVGHSLGGMITLQYAGLFPENVLKVAAIEGLGPSPKMLAERAGDSVDGRVRKWFEELRGIAGRAPRRYASIEEAFQRMQSENPHLSAEQARHLTIHGANQNEDGTYSWKFDNYVRIWPPYGLTFQEITQIWQRITCPTLLFRGTESWASDPTKDGRIEHFKNPTFVNIEGAGHWAHHDRFGEFMRILRDFLAA
jgi:pimeloyl-ACP methyl ester carboxylesterase